MSAAYVALVKGAFGVDESWATDEFSPPLAVAVLTVAVLPAFNEEWTDRGVLWVALRRISGPGTTILCTALLFAFMHGLGGAGLLEVPHRFTLGVLYGYLRHRTGSLWPGIVAHALHNMLSLVW